MSSTPFGGRDSASVPQGTRGRHLAPREKRGLRALGTMPVQLVGTLVGRGGPTEGTARRPHRRDIGRAAAPVVTDAAVVALEDTVAVERPVLDPGTIEVVVDEGESAADVAARLGVSTASLLALNGLSWRSVLAAGDVLRVRPVGPRPDPGPEPERHVVRAGETIASIAAAHAVPTAAVLLANGLSRGSALMPGQRLVLPPVPRRDAEALTLTGEMLRQATRIITIGRRTDVPDDGIVAALVAAMHDSSLRNLDFGDGGGLGLFQRVPDTGWGDRAAILDPEHAILAFFGGAHSPVWSSARGLLDVPGWSYLSVGEMAATVQGGGAPGGEGGSRTSGAAAYAKWEPFARGWLRSLSRPRAAIPPRRRAARAPPWRAGATLNCPS
jgi:LysM repeat protein